MRIAIIGGGAAGLTTAYLLDKTHHVTLFEKQPILGGNVRTLGKNVSGVELPDGVFVDNGVIEFQQDNFVNFHTLLDKLGVQYEPINGGSSSFYGADGRFILGPHSIKHGNLSLGQQISGICKLIGVFPQYSRFMSVSDISIKRLKDKPISYFVKDGTWSRWQKMLLMYAYSIPYAKIPDFPAEIAVAILRQSGLGTKWTRIVGGVYSYMEAILGNLQNTTVRTSANIHRIRRGSDGVAIELAGDEMQTFDKLVFACPPDQVLKLLVDTTPEERIRFAAWEPNHATTLIHHDVGIYTQYGVDTYTEFDVFEKPNQDAGYNAYLNRLAGLPESSPHQYHLAYNLADRIDPDKVIQTQDHHVPLYTTESLKYRQVVRDTNGENHTYHAGAWMGNGLHEGAVNSAVAVAQLLDGDVQGFV